MSGTVYVVGVGPGHPDQITPEALAAIGAATALLGYGPYLDRLVLGPGQERIASDNREELDRAREALDRAVAGETVCVVSGGDPGVFAMAAAVCEAIDADGERYGAVNLTVVPGISAMLAVAARVGAPLGHDFCVMSLSDNLKPWTVITDRLRAAARAGFALALYNPISRGRPWQLGEALDLLRGELGGETVVVFGRAVGRPDERVTISTIAAARPEMADMATCIIVGTAQTRRVARHGQPDIVYTPRFHREPS
jgi:precorrin-3B C17-methyltransferase